MDSWAGWVLGSLCVAGVVLKAALTGWALFELYRKWRSVPELWGIDWLDITFRVERQFGVVLTAADFRRMTPDERGGLTVGELWELMRSEAGGRGPVSLSDGWARLVHELSDALNLDPARVRPESRLIADLGMSNEIE